MVARRKFKTKKQLNGPQLYRKWADYTIGDWLIGKFVGIHHDKTYGKEHFKLQIIDGELKGEDMDKFIDKILVLNTNGMLEKAMTDVIEGDIIQVEYNGMDSIDKGPYAGNDAHSVTVSVVEEEEEEGYAGEGEENAL